MSEVLILFHGSASHSMVGTELGAKSLARDN